MPNVEPESLAGWPSTHLSLRIYLAHHIFSCKYLSTTNFKISGNLTITRFVLQQSYTKLLQQRSIFLFPETKHTRARMCRNTVTRCVECKEYIDSLLVTCRKHTEIMVGTSHHGYCPVTHSLDGHGIDPATGLPYDTTAPTPLLNLSGVSYNRHPLQRYGTICVWCWDKQIRGKTAAKKEEYRVNLYWKTQDVTSLYHIDGKLVPHNKPDARWQGYVVDKQYHAFWKPNDAWGKQFDIEQVEQGKSRGTTLKQPAHLLTYQWDFPFYEGKVYQGAPTTTLQEVREWNYANCPPGCKNSRVYFSSTRCACTSTNRP